MSKSNKNKSSLRSKQVDSELEAKDGLITTLTKKLAATSVVNRRLVIALIGLSVFVVGAGTAVAAYHFDVVDTLEDKLSGTRGELSSTQSSLEKAKEESAEQGLLISKATEEIEALKQESAEKTAQEAQEELEAKLQAEKDAKRFVIATKKDSNLQGLNVRNSPCGEKVGPYQVWGNAGEVISGPEQPGECLGGDFEWYKIRWNDGMEGWSIADYFDFSASRSLNNTGVITGYAPYGFNFEEETKIAPSICATNQSDGITYCNASLNEGRNTYTLELPAGRYLVSGTYRYMDWESKNIVNVPLRHTLFEACGYTVDCYNKFGESDGAAIVDVNAGDVLAGINLSSVKK